jgi:hypothetical protein
MRNKLGGHVFSKNKGGSFMRRKVSPAQPRTSAQTLIRAGMTTLSKRWGGTLLDTQRAAWQAFALNNPTKDVFGATVVLTGEQTYLRLNQAVLMVGAPIIDDPPNDLSVQGISSFTSAPNGTTPAFTISAVAPVPLLSTDCYMVWATRQMSPGRESLATFYRFLTNYQGNQALPFDLKAYYEAKFGTLDTDKVLGLGIRVLNTLNGAQSPLFTKRLIVL